MHTVLGLACGCCHCLGGVFFVCVCLFLFLLSSEKRNQKQKKNLHASGTVNEFDLMIKEKSVCGCHAGIAFCG